MEMLSNLGTMGMGQASGIMVGQNLGAGRPDRARTAVGWALIYVVMFQIVLGTTIFAFPTFAVNIFTHEAGVVDLTSTWLRLQVFAAFFMALSNVFQQSYNTAGDTLVPLIVVFVGVWAVEIPLAWFLVHHTSIGVLGIGVAAIAAMGTRLLGYVPYFFYGRWLRIKVLA